MANTAKQKKALLIASDAMTAAVRTLDALTGGGVKVERLSPTETKILKQVNGELLHALNVIDQANEPDRRRPYYGDD